ncbi:hypothetical protein CSKR_101084, partial [Clonorchis sinensis]
TDTTQTDQRKDRNPTARSITLRSKETCVTSKLELVCEKSGPTRLCDNKVTQITPRHTDPCSSHSTYFFLFLYFPFMKEYLPVVLTMTQPAGWKMCDLTEGCERDHE